MFFFDKRKNGANGGEPKKPANLVVANHVSYMDVLVLMALKPMVFITSTEVRGLPLVGLLCKWAGCLFVDRKRPRSLIGVSESVKDLLTLGQDVAFFPEATTSIGAGVLPFRSPLFEGAVHAKAKVFPVGVSYLGDEVTRRKIAFIEDDDFFQHLWGLCGLNHGIRIQVTVLEGVPALEKKEVCHYVHSLISGEVKKLANARKERSPRLFEALGSKPQPTAF